MAHAFHPSGLTVEIVGIEASDNGRSCERHEVCGIVLADDVVVRLRKIQILNAKGKEESAIGAFWVSDGVDQCLVGFLRKHLVPHAIFYNGLLAQVTEVFDKDLSESPRKKAMCRNLRGCCLAAIISAETSESIRPLRPMLPFRLPPPVEQPPPSNKRRKTAGPQMKKKKGKPKRDDDDDDDSLFTLSSGEDESTEPEYIATRKAVSGQKNKRKPLAATPKSTPLLPNSNDDRSCTSNTVVDIIDDFVITSKRGKK
jgi:hypothetical protein